MISRCNVSALQLSKSCSFITLPRPILRLIFITKVKVFADSGKSTDSDSARFALRRMVQPGDLVVLQQRAVVHRVPGFEREAARTPRLAIVFEDDHMAVVVKPQGMPTQVGRTIIRGRQTDLFGVIAVEYAACKKPCTAHARLMRLWQGAGASGLGAHSCLVYTLKPSPLAGELASGKLNSAIPGRPHDRWLAEAVARRTCSASAIECAIVKVVRRLLRRKPAGSDGTCSGCQAS